MRGQKMYEVITRDGTGRDGTGRDGTGYVAVVYLLVCNCFVSLGMTDDCLNCLCNNVLYHSFCTSTVWSISVRITPLSATNCPSLCFSSINDWFEGLKTVILLMTVENFSAQKIIL